MKPHKTLRKLKDILHVALQCERGIYIMKSQINTTDTTPPPKRSCMEERTSKYFMGTVPRHTFTKRFQPRTGHGVLGKCF